jgi:hypothetical protein
LEASLAGAGLPIFDTDLKAGRTRLGSERPFLGNVHQQISMASP